MSDNDRHNLRMLSLCNNMVLIYVNIHDHYIES